MRIAFSVVDGRAHIRPHTGPTNEQLKLHFGVVVPTPGEANCTWLLRADGDARPWVQGEAHLFDDSFEHEVLSECTANKDALSAGERVVLQITLRHPAL
jgi:aspartyl/asparaginyl beta-hydroxylase (cupin superfamily)